MAFSVSITIAFAVSILPMLDGVSLTLARGLLI